MGRPRATYPDNWDEVYAAWKEGLITAKKAMELLDLKRTTFYKFVKLQEQHGDNDEYTYQCKAATGTITAEEEKAAALLRRKGETIGKNCESVTNSV